MPNIVLTIYRENTIEEWFDPTEENWPKYFTQDEINNVLKPFKDGFTSLPGFLGEEVTYSDNEKRISKFRFDTKEHCEDGLRYKMDSVSDLAIARNALFKRKKEEYGINYVFLTDIEL